MREFRNLATYHVDRMLYVDWTIKRDFSATDASFRCSI
jgi:hypothetical protein